MAEEAMLVYYLLFKFLAKIAEEVKEKTEGHLKNQKELEKQKVTEQQVAKVLKEKYGIESPEQARALTRMVNNREKYGDTVVEDLPAGERATISPLEREEREERARNRTDNNQLDTAIDLPPGRDLPGQ